MHCNNYPAIHCNTSVPGSISCCPPPPRLVQLAEANTFNLTCRTICVHWGLWLLGSRATWLKREMTHEKMIQDSGEISVCFSCFHFFFCSKALRDVTGRVTGTKRNHSREKGLKRDITRERWVTVTSIFFSFLLAFFLSFFESRVFIENWLWVSQGCGSYLIHHGKPWAFPPL